MRTNIPSISKNYSIEHEKNLFFLQECINSKKYEEAINFSIKKIECYPDVIGYQKTLAFCYSMVGKLEEAKELWINLINIDPFSEETLINLADIERRLDRLDSAKGLLKLAIQYHPQSIRPLLSFAVIQLLEKNYSEVLNTSLEAIKLDPSNADAYQNLGSSFFHLAQFDEAKHAFETALILDPNLKEAKHSLSLVLFKQGKNHESLNILENLISSHHDTDRLTLEQLEWDASLVNLRLGHLEKGWKYYESGLSPKVFGNLSRRPLRTFTVPKWTPFDSKNNPVLVWSEQGIGDEIIFMTCLQDLVDSGYNIIVECDSRLVSLYQRSFQNVIFRQSKFDSIYPYSSFYNDFASQIAMGSLLQYFRPSFSHFKDRSGFIKADTHLIKKWQNRLAYLNKDKFKIGISWRSSLLDPLRNKKYSNLMNWDSLFNSNIFEFINLQYGDCDNEILQVEKRFDLKINRFPELDLKNDLDNVFALLNCLDIVITTSSAIWTFAASSGIPTYLLLHTAHWTMFNLEINPFFSVVKCLVTEKNQNIEELLPIVINDIKNTRVLNPGIL